MKIILKPCTFGILLSLLFLCSCATEHPAQLPADVSINKSAGYGDFLLMKIHLEDGEELPFIVDTGCPVTILDESLEPKLGKQLGTATIRYGWYGKKKGKLFNAPKLYLGNTQLLTGHYVKTSDVQQFAHGVMGILGMDCLRHYCVQFDFVAKKMRFLNPDLPDKADLGEAFPLTILFNYVFTHPEFYGLGKTYFRVDTGDSKNDVVLKSKLLQRELRMQTLVFTARSKSGIGKTCAVAGFSQVTFGDETYTNLMLMEWGGTWLGQNIIGLPLLARNLVTFDFPKRVMYLKQESAGPLSPGYFPNFEAKQFLVELEKKRQLPGLTNDPQGELRLSKLADFESYPISLTFDFRKKDDVSIFHYLLDRESEDSQWKLQKAWQTDEQGKTIKEFSAP